MGSVEVAVLRVDPSVVHANHRVPSWLRPNAHPYSPATVPHCDGQHYACHPESSASTRMSANPETATAGAELEDTASSSIRSALEAAGSDARSAVLRPNCHSRSRGPVGLCGGEPRVEVGDLQADRARGGLGGFVEPGHG